MLGFWMTLADRPLAVTTELIVAAVAVVECELLIQLRAPAIAALSATFCNRARWA
jgi:hypothetical protein